MLLRRAASAAALLLTALPIAVTSPAHAADGASSCRHAASAPLDAEQARLADARTTALVERAGFADFVRRLPAALCTTRSAAEAERLLDSWGQALWQASVRRAQGQRHGDLAPGDDRPLYWARLSMTAVLARWQPEFTIDRAALRARFEDASRGLTDNDFRPAPGVRRIFISGFDPFGLDAEIRRANPSGSAALQLNGRRVVLADGSPAEIRAVVLPVRYADFDAGMVERAFAPRLAAAGHAPADIITTVSQGYPGIFTLEDWAGRARSADPYPDNARALSGGTRERPVTAPGLGPGPEFIRTTLPADAVTAAVQTPYPVLLNTEVTEIPAGATTPVDRIDGPTPGSRAVAGGGGGYLSNEVAYRSNRLRAELAPHLPGGHLHTPVLTGLPADSRLLTGPEFERNESAITAEVRAVLEHAAVRR